MRQTRFFLVGALLLASLALVGGTGCGGSSGGGDDEEPIDQPPTVTILEPATGTEFAQGELISFVGRGTDPEDGDLPETVLNWSSSINGPFGLGFVVRKDDLSHGVHEITLRGIDSANQFVTDTVEITVLAPIRAINTAGDLLITEIQANPGLVPGVDGEWFEIYNPTDFRLDLAGLTVRDDGVVDFFQIPNSRILDPKTYFVFGRNGDVTANGGAPVDYAYGTLMSLDNSVDEIVLIMGPTTIDRVNYDVATWPLTEGIAMSLSEDALDDVQNDDPTNWCEPAALYGPLLLQGTPQEANPICTP